MTTPSQLIRANNDFIKEIEEIRENREKLKINKLSYSNITSLIIRHKAWQKIKIDIINYGGYND